MTKLAILCSPGQDSFLPDLIREFRKEFTVRQFAPNYDRAIPDAYRWGDVVWVEWADYTAIQAAGVQPAFGKPLFIRAHSYEAFTPFPRDLRWDRVTGLVVTSAHVLGYLVEKAGTAMPADLPRVMIPSAIDLERFRFDPDRERGHRIGVLANWNGKKGVVLWLHAFQAMRSVDAELTLHLAGRCQDERFDKYLHHMVEAMGLTDAVTFDGYVDAAEWWQDKDFCLSTSPHEGCPYNVLEAMACGVVPLVHTYRGAETQFPGLTWDTLGSIHGVLEMHDDPSFLRAFVENHHDIVTRTAETVAWMRSLL